MATHTLTQASPQQDFILLSDGDVQVFISTDSVFTSFSKFEILYETDTPGTFIPVPGTDTTIPYSRVYTFKAGTLRLNLAGANAKTSVTVDIK